MQKHSLCSILSLSASVFTLLALNAICPDKAGAQTNIPITNYSFEDPTQGVAQHTANGAIPGWSTSGLSAIGVWYPSPLNAYFHTTAPDGNQVGYISDGSVDRYNGASIAQQTAATVMANQKYTLTAAFGHRLDGYTGTADLQLWAGGSVVNGVVSGGTEVANILVDTNSILAGYFQDFSTVYTAPSDAGLLSVRIVDVGGSGVQGNQVDFDNARLTVTPESSSLLLLLGGGGGLSSVIALRRRFSRKSA